MREIVSIEDIAGTHDYVIIDTSGLSLAKNIYQFCDREEDINFLAEMYSCFGDLARKHKNFVWIKNAKEEVDYAIERLSEKPRRVYTPKSRKMRRGKFVNFSGKKLDDLVRNMNYAKNGVYMMDQKLEQGVSRAVGIFIECASRWISESRSVVLSKNGSMTDQNLLTLGYTLAMDRNKCAIVTGDKGIVLANNAVRKIMTGNDEKIKPFNRDVSAVLEEYPVSVFSCLESFERYEFFSNLLPGIGSRIDPEMREFAMLKPAVIIIANYLKSAGYNVAIP